MRTVYMRGAGGVVKLSRPDGWSSDDEISREEFDKLREAAAKRLAEEQASADIVPPVREMIAALTEQVASIADSVAELQKNNGNGNDKR